MIKTFHSSVIFLLIFQSSIFASIGQIETKRERLKREAQERGFVVTDTERRAPEAAVQPFMEKMYENFLKGNYSETESLAGDYLISHASFQDADEAAYLQALSLLKLGRLEEARLKLNKLGQSARSASLRAGACASLGDSYAAEHRPDLALLWYQEVVEKYPETDEASYARDEIRKIGKPAGKTEAKTSAPVGLFYTVQVGSFSDERNAKALIKKLESHEYNAYLEKDDAKRFFRVRVGRLGRKEDARVLETSLKQEGYSTRIYP